MKLLGQYLTAQTQAGTHAVLSLIGNRRGRLLHNILHSPVCSAHRPLRRLRLQLKYDMRGRVSPILANPHPDTLLHLPQSCFDLPMCIVLPNNIYVPTFV